MNLDIKLAYLVAFKISSVGRLDCVKTNTGLWELNVQHDWVGKGENFWSFALRVLVGRLR